MRNMIILNPVSGGGAGGRSHSLIERLLQSHNLDFDLVATERPWHAAELAEQAAMDGYDHVVAAGGDGTANEVLNGLMLAKQAGAGGSVAMGMLCIGRGNDFAFGVGVPPDLEAGCRVLAEGNRRMIDVGWAVGGDFPEGRHFGNGVGIGFDAVVGFEALKMKRLQGFVSYLAAALKTIMLYYRAPLVRIELDGEMITQPSLMISIMNGRRMGGVFMMTPEAEIDDGKFDLCIAGQMGRLSMLALMARFTRGTQATHTAIRTGRARRVVVTALEDALPAHADGETLCTDGQRLSLELQARQIEVVCQAEDDTR